MSLIQNTKSALQAPLTVEGSTRPKMEFLDISLTKGSSLLLHAIHSIFYWRILQKAFVFSGFENPYKKSAKQENERKNEGRKTDKYSSLKRLAFMPRTSTKNSFKNSISWKNPTKSAVPSGTMSLSDKEAGGC